MIKNKKAVSFAIGIILAAFAVTIFALYAGLTTSNQRIKMVTLPLEFFNSQSEAREFYFYVQEDAKLSSQKALYELLENIPTEGNGDCDILSGDIVAIVFSDDCTLGTMSAINDKFLDEFISSYSQASNFNFFVSGKKLRAGAKEELSYSSQLATYTIDPSFTLELAFSLDELALIYDDSKNAVDACKEEEEEEIINCVNEHLLKPEDFDISVSKTGSFLIFRAETKQRLFFDDAGGSGLQFGKRSFDYSFSLT